VARTLLQHGWKNVKPLLGGFDAWKDAAYRTEPKLPQKQTVREVAANVSEAKGDDGVSP
jgi:3-mercaptopyruvate sulfurtransferase SseA